MVTAALEQYRSGIASQSRAQASPSLSQFCQLLSCGGDSIKTYLVNYFDTNDLSTVCQYGIRNYIPVGHTVPLTVRKSLQRGGETSFQNLRCSGCYSVDELTTLSERSSEARSRKTILDRLFGLDEKTRSWAKFVDWVVALFGCFWVRTGQTRKWCAFDAARMTILVSQGSLGNMLSLWRPFLC